MTVWLDAHLPPDLAPWLGVRFGVTAKCLSEIGLASAKDRVIFDAAARYSDVVIMTKDADFAALVQRLGAPPKVILLAVGNCPLLALQLVLGNVLEDVLARLESGESFVEITAAP